MPIHSDFWTTARKLKADKFATVIPGTNLIKKLSLQFLSREMLHYICFALLAMLPPLRLGKLSVLSHVVVEKSE